jgi:DNA-binding CsgD family transcriptional regulator
MDPEQNRQSDRGISEIEDRETQRDVVLTSILRKRRRPILLIIDEDGDLVSSSVPDSAAAAEHRLLGQALAEAKSLFQQQFRVDQAPGNSNGSRLVVDGPEQRSTLVALGHEFFSLRVMPLHGAADEPGAEQFAALVEPIVEPLADRVDFDLIKAKYRLSNREIDVLEALMSGRKDKEIANSVGLTAGTVRSYLKSIRAKLGVTTRTAIVNLVHEFIAEGPRTSN